MNINELLIYEDDSIIIFNKPQGIPTAPGKRKSFCEYVFKEYEELKNVNGYKEGEGGLLNRLDNETGGLLLFAKNNESFLYYKDQMGKKKVNKFYKAVVNGRPLNDNGILSIPIAHHYKKKKKMICVQDKIKYRGKSQDAVTEYKIVKSNDDLSLLDILIKKGVRHQIRIHLSHKGIPIVGDKLYNKIKCKEKNHLLFAYALEFNNFYNKRIKIKIDVPFENYLS